MVKLREKLLQIVVDRCGGLKKLDKVCFDMAVKGELVVKLQRMRN